MIAVRRLFASIVISAQVRPFNRIVINTVGGTPRRFTLQRLAAMRSY